MNLRHITSIISLFAIAISFSNCEKNSDNGNENGNGNGNEQSEVVSINVSGFAQKGQFIKGSSVTAYALDDKLISKGSSYPASISDDLGSFKISASTDAKYLEFRAEGYYFIENTGKISSNPIYLQALAESTEKNVNINLLTTLTVPRIKQLVSTGEAFSKAKQQSQNEILKAISKNSYEVSADDFNEMDITKDSDANAVLLAISCLLQQGRNTGEALALIADISAEFEKTGAISEGNINKLYANKEDIDILHIIDNLNQFYESKELFGYAIPPFYKYTGNYNGQFFSLGYIVDRPEFFGGASFSKDGDEDIYYVLSAFNPVPKTNVDWISFEVSNPMDDFYAIRVVVDKNEGDQRNAVVSITDGSDSVFDQFSVSQDASLQILLIGNSIGEGTKSSFNDAIYNPVPDGSSIYVNGQYYDIPNDGSRRVAVPFANAYSIAYPASFASKYNDGNNLIRFNYPSEFDDYFIPLLSYLSSPSNPAQVEWMCLSANLMISHSGGFHHAKFIANDGAFMSGVAIYDAEKVLQGGASHGSSLSGSNTVTVNDKDEDGTVVISVPPQTIESLTVELYDEQGNVIVTKTRSSSFTVYQGHIYNMGSI